MISIFTKNKNTKTIQNTNAASRTRDSYMSVFYVSCFLVNGFNALVGYTRSGYLVELGLSQAQYGYLLSVCGIILVFTQTMIGRLIDMKSNSRIVLMKAFTVLGIVSCIIFIITQSIFILLLATAIQIICLSSYMNISKTLVTIISNPKKLNRSLGLLQLGGSTGWIVFSIAFGYILTYVGSKLIFAAAGTLLVIQFLLIYFKLPKDISVGNQRTATRRWNDFSVLAKVDRRIFVFLGAAMLLSISQSGGISYMYLFLKNVGHVSDSLAGWIISFSGFVEIPLTFAIGAYCDKHKKEWLFIIMALFGSMRWILLNYITHPALYFGIQTLHAIDCCAMVIVMIGMISDYVSIEDRGTVLGMFASVASIGGILGPFIMGYMTDVYDMKVAMTTMGGFGLSAVLIIAAYVVTHDLKFKRTT